MVAFWLNIISSSFRHDDGVGMEHSFPSFLTLVDDHTRRSWCTILFGCVTMVSKKKKTNKKNWTPFNFFHFVREKKTRLFHYYGGYQLNWFFWEENCLIFFSPLFRTSEVGWGEIIFVSFFLFLNKLELVEKQWIHYSSE